jgi:uncharacterized protein DUF4347
MVIDVVDVVDQALQDMEAADIRAQGGSPIALQYSTTNAVAILVQLIIERAAACSIITLLRFHGHGGPGGQNVAAGEAVYDAFGNGISITNLAVIGGDLARLRPYFAAHARVEMHGCQVASGRNGQNLLRRLAGIWGVQVSAGSRTQRGGGTRTFRFEGPVYTGYPDGRVVRRP